jgi:hypothetical protein
MYLQRRRCCIFVAGGETKCNPRIGFEHVFSAARESFEQSSSVKIAAIATPNIYSFLPKSVIGRAHPRKMGYNRCMIGIYNAVGVADFVAGGETK